jgi:hypothetical protein
MGSLHRGIQAQENYTGREGFYNCAAKTICKALEEALSKMLFIDAECQSGC